MARLSRDRQLALMAEGRKGCPACGEILPFDEFFPPAPSQKANGMRTSPYCKVCTRGKNKENIKRVYFKKQYGLTVEEVAVLKAGTCFICGGTDRLCIDHDHTSGKVRGVLCNHCNLVLGHCGDSPERLRALADYLEL